MGEIFISHASADGVLAACVAEGLRSAGHGVFLDSDREDGIAPGAAWQRILLRELRVCDAVVFLNSAPGQASKWCHSELVIAADLGKRIYSLDLWPDLPPHPLLGSVQGITFGAAIEASIERLAGELDLDGLAGSTRPRWQRGRPPYPGLAAMDVADAGVFFGREDEVRDLLARVDGPLGRRDGDLVVVMGHSGVGKSSLVRAGLAARLAVPRRVWAVASPFEPGVRPLDQLASRLTSLIARPMTGSECRDRLLAEGLAAFGEWLVNHSDVPVKRLLITLDQAEQLATVTPRGDCEEFLSVLGGGLGAGSPVTIVLTVRSDRFEEVQRLSVIGPAIQAPFILGPIPRSQLAMVIEGPARRADLAFAPGLVSVLMDEAATGSGGDPADALPFLAFVLREMYDLAAQEDRAVFVRDDYERVGRIESAIIRRVQAVEASLRPGSEPTLNRLLQRFVTLSEKRLPAGQPIPRELLTTAERPIVDRLEDQRLLIGAGDTVRLAHEQLITAWPRLAKAADDLRDGLILQDRLNRQAADWKDGHGELLGPDATKNASRWLANQAEPSTSQTVVGEYIRACQASWSRRRARRTTAVVLAATALLWITATVVLQGLHGTVQSVRGTTSPAYLDVIKAHAALSDADRAAWQSFRSGEADFTGPGLRYQDDIANAGLELRLAVLSGPAGSQRLQTASGQLVNYQALVEQADAAYRADTILGNSRHALGYADLAYASHSLRDPGGLLSTISELAAADQQAVQRQLASPWADPALILAPASAGLLALGSIIATQGLPRRRFRRMISPPLMLAAALVCALMAWETLVILHADAAFTAARRTALSQLTRTWQTQIRVVDARAAELRATESASRALDADLAAAGNTGGLPAGIPALAATIAVLAWLGIKPRLDEYRG